MNKAFLADIVPPLNREGIFGKINAASSIGFIVGPTVAGLIMLSGGGFKVVAYLSGAIFLLNALLNYFVISRYVENVEELSEERRDFSLLAVFNVFRDAHRVPWHLVWDAFVIRSLMSFSIMIYRANFTSILTSKFGTDHLTNGYIQSLNGAVSMATGFLLANIRAYFSTNSLMHDSFAVVLVLTLFALSVTPSIWIYILCIIPLCVSTSVLRVSNTTAIANQGGEETRGLVMGFADTLTAIGRAFAPIIAGYAMELSYSAPGLCATVFALCGTLISMYGRRLIHQHAD